ncbi:MAG: peroxidase [Clostridia bacterium]|nr:peroxidase [Clostridia bacterium]
MEHHGEALRLETNREFVEALKEDYTKVLDNKDIEMIGYAIKLTKAPHSIIEEDIINLRELGFEDRDIFDINQVVAYFNYVNRIASGLGVELE